jgi:hypothetical protein
LIAAVDDLRDAARSANYEYGNEIADIYNFYSPHGGWDETVAVEKNKIADNLKTVESELQILATKLKENQ